MKIKGLLAAFAIASMVGGSAFAVSDGNYDPSRMSCSGAADNYNHPDQVEEGCHSIEFVIFDGNGHEYFGFGTFQTPDGTFVHSGEWWFDPGQGTRYSQYFDENGPQDVVQEPSTQPEADPSTGMHAYFGADDNLDGGEHDSSPQVNNGPSDGGAIQLNIDPNSPATWAEGLQSDDAAGFLARHPLPLGDFGMGACADGICLALQTQERLAFDGGHGGERFVYDYAGKEWDPDTCAGPSDKPEDCSTESHPGSLQSWQEGKTYVEPGIQIFEDPDAQASPIGPYPLPAIYIGTCGIALGGGDFQFPDSPMTNSAGQVIISTVC